MNLSDDIEKLLDGDVAPGQQWVDEAMQRYPYFTLPLLLHVKHTSDNEALQRLAIMSPDRRDLAIMAGSAPAAFAHFYPDAQPGETPSVDSIIDKFLDTYAAGSNQKEIDALSNAIFNPTPDYADILAAQDDGAALNDKEDELINSFIAHYNSTQNDDSMLSESLAKMYIARHKYSKALEIIESINLNFPEKSIYFADQIRFLRKLVLIETLKNKL